MYRTIRVRVEGPLARVTFARPKVKNAFNDELIAELADALRELGSRKSIRVATISGEGGAFSAGADLNWMKKTAKYDYDKNLEDAKALAELLETLYSLPQATIARVNGPAIGGGVGLVAACDIAVASREAFFSLSEVRLGLVPACIAPYVIRRVGEGQARQYFLTGRKFDAEKALEIGLVTRVVNASKLDDEVGKWEDDFLRCGPRALAACKELISRASCGDIAELKEYTSKMIADLRVSAEGREGIAAFFKKKKPPWDQGGD